LYGAFVWARRALHSATRRLPARAVLLMIILVAYPVIDLIPLAGLVGVMFNMIFFHIFDWVRFCLAITILGR
jgi:hypothetical protein